MAIEQEKLTDLPVATSTSTGDKYLLVQSGVDKQIDFDDMGFGGGGDSEIIYNVKSNGAKGDGIQLLDGAITASDATFTSATATFVVGDIGKVVHIEGAGTGGAYHTTTIASFTSATEVELTDNAITTVSVSVYVYGTDDTVGIQTTIQACFDGGGGTVYIPNGIYIIDGALQNNIGADLIDYNSQLYIPRTDIQVTSDLPTILIKGETPPFVVQGTGIDTVEFPQLSGACLISTIQGSGTDPSVIGSRGKNSGDFFDLMNFTQSYYENLNVLTTVDANSKATVGGINCFRSVVSGFEKCVVFLYNLNLFDSGEPDVIDVTGISYSGLDATKLGYIKNCNVGGFTNGYRSGEHGLIESSAANVCVNGLLQETNNHTHTILKIHFDWCKNGITFNGAAQINVVDFMGEFSNNGKWFDTVSHINDPSSLGTGNINYNIVEAGVGFNNSLFEFIGGANLRFIPISFNDISDITVSGDTDTEKIDSLILALTNSGFIKVISVLQNMVHYYRFNDDLVDQISALDGTGTAITYVTGKSGNAANFNGSTSFVELADNDSLSFPSNEKLSMSFFLKFDTVSATFLMSKRQSGEDEEWQINYTGTAFQFVLYSNGGSANNISRAFTHTPIVGTWYYLTFTYSGSGAASGIKIYIDAVSGGTTATAGSFVSMTAGGANVYIGKREVLNDLHLDGVIDGLAIYKGRELSASEVTDNYNTQNGGSELV